MTKLTPEQEQLLEFVHTADRRWRDAKTYAKKRAAELVEQEIRQHADVRDRAVFDAVTAGIPKAQVGIRGLGTSSPGVPGDIYNRVLASIDAGAPTLAQKPRPAFEWNIGPSFGEYGDAWVVTAADYPNVMDLSELNLAAQFGWSGEIDGWVYRWDRGRWTVCGPAKVPEKVAEWVDRNPPAPVE